MDKNGKRKLTKTGMVRLNLSFSEFFADALDEAMAAADMPPTGRNKAKLIESILMRAWKSKAAPSTQVRHRVSSVRRVRKQGGVVGETVNANG